MLFQESANLAFVPSLSRRSSVGRRVDPLQSPLPCFFETMICSLVVSHILSFERLGGAFPLFLLFLVRIYRYPAVTWILWFSYALIFGAVCQLELLRAIGPEELRLGYVESFQALGEELKWRLSNIVTYLDHRTGPLFRTLTLGESYLMGRRTLDEFKLSGLYHLLVISGFHVSIILNAFNLCLATFIRIPMVICPLAAVIVRPLEVFLGILPLILGILILQIVQGVPAQRAVICTGVASVLNQLSLQLPWVGRIWLMMLVHFTMFGSDFFSRSSFLSWFCYILISFPLNMAPKMTKLFRQFLLSFVPFIFFGQLLPFCFFAGLLTSFVGYGLFLWVVAVSVYMTFKHTFLLVLINEGLSLVLLVVRLFSYLNSMIMSHNISLLSELHSIRWGIFAIITMFVLKCGYDQMPVKE
jgi:predicted membrane metal-binding protein